MQEYAKRLLFFIETRWNVRTRIAKRLWSPSEEKVFKRLRWDHSLRADEIKLWLTPSAKQRRNPCSGLPAVYPDLVRATIGQLKKAFVLFVVIANQVEGEFETHFR